MLWLPLVSLVALVQTPDHARSPSATQALSQDLADPVQVEDVEVRARRGAALVAPVTELNGAEIDALAAWDIGEVLKRMQESLGGAEEPMVIINGKRVPNSSIFSGFPPDALVRLEILPPEAAALYGGRPSQQVINLVLQPRFESHDIQGSATRPTQGGTSTLSADARRSSIVGQDTHMVSAELSRSTALRAGERSRDLDSDHLGAADVTLRPGTDAFSASAHMTRSLGSWSGMFSLNGQARDTHSTVLIGGTLAANRQRSESLMASAGASGEWVGWSVQANLNASLNQSHDDGFNDADNQNTSVGLTTSANRLLFEWPAGPVTANLLANLLQTRSVLERDGTETANGFRSNEMRGGLTIPVIKTATEGVGRVVGGLAASVGGSLRESDAGTGEELNAGLSWSVRPLLRLDINWLTSGEAVSSFSRSEPLYFGTPRIVFDFRTGEAIEVLPIMGGNPDLSAPRSERLSLTASVGQFSAWKVSAYLGYARMESSNGIGSIPDLTEDVEAAFPDRFQRGADGRLVSIDYRPFNLSSSLSETLSTNVNFSLPTRSRDGVAPPEATTFRFSLGHTLQLSNRMTLAAGLPDLDRLAGDGGGQSKQNLNASLDARRGRWGINGSARWQGGYRTRRVGGSDSDGDLVMQPFSTLDLKVSYQMTSTARPADPDSNAPPPRRSGGLQLGLEVRNLLDARPEARLASGAPAPGFGRDIQDPIGRTVRLTLQRRF